MSDQGIEPNDPKLSYITGEELVPEDGSAQFVQRVREKLNDPLFDGTNPGFGSETEDELWGNSSSFEEDEEEDAEEAEAEDDDDDDDESNLDMALWGE